MPRHCSGLVFALGFHLVSQGAVLIAWELRALNSAPFALEIGAASALRSGVSLRSPASRADLALYNYTARMPPSNTNRDQSREPSLTAKSLRPPGAKRTLRLQTARARPRFVIARAASARESCTTRSRFSGAPRGARRSPPSRTNPFRPPTAPRRGDHLAGWSCEMRCESRSRLRRISSDSLIVCPPRGPASGVPGDGLARFCAAASASCAVPPFAGRGE